MPYNGQRKGFIIVITHIRAASSSEMNQPTFYSTLRSDPGNSKMFGEIIDARTKETENLQKSRSTQFLASDGRIKSSRKEP